MGLNISDKLHKNRAESRIDANIDNTLNEIAGLEYGNIEQFPRSDKNDNYITTIENENIIWLPQPKSEKYVRATELKCRWWFERSDNKLIIHIIEPEYTEDELAILKTSFNEPVNGQITMKHSDTITIDHDNVSYILGRINSSELFCVYNCFLNSKCPLEAKITLVLNKMMISIQNPIKAQEKHKEHSTTPLPPPLDFVPFVKFKEIIESHKTKNNVENDKYPLCTGLTDDKYVWCQGIKFTKVNLSGYRA